MTTIRSFLGLPISSQPRAKLEQILQDLQETPADVKWVQPENIHLTLKFFGDLTLDQIESVSSFVKELCRAFVSAESFLCGMGAFPDMRRPKVVWAALYDPNQRFQAMAEAVDEEMAKLHVARNEHPFKPHITLGRVRSSLCLNELTQKMQKITFEEKIPQTFDKMVLYKSTLTPYGSIYEVLGEFEIKG